MSNYRKVARAGDKRADLQFNEVIRNSDKPAPHNETHKSGGSDPLSPADIGANSITNFNDHESAGNPHSASQARQGGTTANRPSSPADFEFYFDTDLGKPIWYDGSNWVDATGSTV